MARHAIVTFLEDQESLKAVDPEFRELVKILHRIPFCATFGVSCSGHVRKNRNYPNVFYPWPWGHLNIIILDDIPHIQELLELFQASIAAYCDVSFRRINHVFGPPENSRLQVWEIRIGDNDCLKGLGGEYFGAPLPIRENKAVYKKARQRYAEIRLFWRDLAKLVSVFCRQHNFRKFVLEKRIEELTKEWKTENISAGI